MDPTAWRARLDASLRGRRVVIGVLPLRSFADDEGLAAMRQELLDAGALDVLFLASVVAGDEPPPAEGIRCVHVPLPRPASLCAGISAEQRVLADPPDVVRRAVAEFDPAGDAVWLGHPFLVREHVLGRRVLGHRPAAWALLEDKALADDLFDAAGVPRAPSLVVPATPDDLAAAAARLDAGAGTVWSGASAGEVHGGAEFVRWVRHKQQAEAAARALTGCDRARVAPFLEGLPCSIHALVLPDGVAATRPVELVVLRRGDSGEFLYAGLSTWWDPLDADREAMRDAARRVGAHLAASVGYRGAFGIDGVLTAEGFVPTELNTRATVALSMVADAGHVPLDALQRALLDGHDPGVTAVRLEQLLVEAADARRTGWVRAFLLTDTAVTQACVAIAGTRGDVRVAGGDGERQPLGELHRRPAPFGGIVRWQPAEGVLAAGDVLSGWAPAVLALADAELGCGLGSLQAPVPAR